MKGSLIFIGIGVFLFVFAFIAINYLPGVHKCNKYCDEDYGGKMWSEFPFIYVHYKCEQSQVVKDNYDYCPDESGFYSPCKTHSCRLLS